jgi:hypothetical protein
MLSGGSASEETSTPEGAKDKAQEVAASAQEAAAPAKEKAREIAGQAKGHAQAAAGQAKQRASAQVDERSTQVGRQVGAQAESLGGVAEELRRQGKEGPAKVAEQAAQRVKDVGDYLERTDGESLVESAKNVARENPGCGGRRERGCRVRRRSRVEGLPLGRLLRGRAARRSGRRGGLMSSAAGPDPRTQTFAGLLVPVDDHPSDGASESEPEVLATARVDKRDEPAADLLKQVSAEASALLRQELTLARAEMTGKAKQAGVGAGMVGGAGYTLHLASLGLMLCLIFALAMAMAAWLVVTVVLAASAAVLALAGRKRIQKAGPPVPEEAIESAKQTIDTVKEEAKWGLGQTS